MKQEYRATENLKEKSLNTKRLALAGIMIASGVLLSGISIPFGPTRCFPFQHSLNVLAGVLLGPWWGASIATIISIIRVSMGTGTLFAFPGSIPGVLAVGLAYKVIRKDWAAFAEPLGTGPVGATLSAMLLGPAMGSSPGMWAMWTAFLISSIPGAIAGFFILVFIRKAKLTEKFNF